ncbi:MAG: hypothetical protein ACRD88_01405 [Terriglobia bacterium]
MKPDLVARLVLELASEDLFGLWEILWAVRGKDPSVGKSVQEAAVRETVRRLLRQGFVNLYRRTGVSSDETLVEADLIESILDAATPWREPHVNEPAYLVGATEKGKKAYLAMFADR